MMIILMREATTELHRRQFLADTKVRYCESHLAPTMKVDVNAILLWAAMLRRQI